MSIWVSFVCMMKNIRFYPCLDSYLCPCTHSRQETSRSGPYKPCMCKMICFFLKLLRAERTKQRNCKPENKQRKKKRSIMKELFCGCRPARQALEIIWSSIIKILTRSDSTDTLCVFLLHDTFSKIIILHVFILPMSLHDCDLLYVDNGWSLTTADQIEPNYYYPDSIQTYINVSPMEDN